MRHPNLALCLSALCFVLVLVCATAAFGDTEQPATRLKGPEHSNCALSCTGFLLRALGRQFSQQGLAQTILSDGRPGNLRAVVEVLEAHGLNVEARRQVSCAELGRYLRGDPNRYVIACTMPVDDSPVLGHAVLLTATRNGFAV